MMMEFQKFCRRWMTTQVGLELLLFSVNSLSASVALIETSPLIWTANQLTGFYMRAVLVLNGLMRMIFPLSNI